ncbi:MAG: aminotransferase class I/II-fold pyridoxal phosphate-dependent enzyme [Vulcanococcus sp.]
MSLAARRLAAVQTPVIPVMGELIRTTPGTLSMGQGMVHWGPPPPVLAALSEAVARADTGDNPGLHAYGPVGGDPTLLEALAPWLIREHGLDLAGASLLVSAGSNMAFNAVVQVLCDPGDELILPVPYYFNHEMAIRLAGAAPVPVQAGLIPDPGQLEAAITPRTRAIVTVSPNNPSGAVIPQPVLAAINRLCAERGLLHICDEAYGLFNHGDTAIWSPGSQPGSAAHTITLGSLSKSHGMAGWRVGWAVVPEALMAELAKVQDTILICPPRLIQRAAAAALAVGAGWCRERIAALGLRRRRVLHALIRPEIQQPWRVLGPADGAFYALLQLNTPLSSDRAMERLIREHGVALVSGSSFGLAGCRLRLSYGMLNDADLDEALRRLLGGLEQLCET